MTADPDPADAPHRVAILAFDGVVPWDIGIPSLVFGEVKRGDGSPAYEVRVCGLAEEVSVGGCGLQARHSLADAVASDTVIIPGFEDVESRSRPEISEAIMAAWERGARIASVCLGAFILAETGLLDGLRATTHWRGAKAFSERFPAVALDPDVLFVDEGRIITSAGASAGLDMCLHLVRRDYGQAVAAKAARMAVAPLEREGGQAQFIHHGAPSPAASLAPMMEWMTANLQRPTSIEVMAARAGASPRTFARRFREQTGTTPLQWLLLARIRRAQELLEAGGWSVSAVASAVGFASPVTFRARFRQIVGVSPAHYRRTFGG